MKNCKKENFPFISSYRVCACIFVVSLEQFCIKFGLGLFAEREWQRWWLLVCASWKLNSDGWIAASNCCTPDGKIFAFTPKRTNGMTFVIFFLI